MINMAAILLIVLSLANYLAIIAIVSIPEFFSKWLLLLCIIMTAFLLLLFVNLRCFEISNAENNISIYNYCPFKPRKCKSLFYMPFDNIIFVDIVKRRWFSVIVICYKYPSNGRIKIFKLTQFGLGDKECEKFVAACRKILKSMLA